MGIRYDAFIAPAQPTLLLSEAFGRLVRDLARERVVHTPWALLAGELCINASLNWESVSDPFPTSVCACQVQGEDGLDEAGDTAGRASQFAHEPPGFEGGHGLFDECTDLRV